MELLTGIGVTGSVFILIVVMGVLMMLARFYRKVEQGWALVRNGIGGTRVSFSGIMVIPIIHRAESIDISVKRVTIDRRGGEGLICKDNLRADIKVAFFVRVNKTVDDVLKVAQSIGCERASHGQALQELFEAKFSEALKTVGKQFEFVELYTSREQFKEQMLKVIGTDLNGFVMDDAAIDFLEQTPVEQLDPDNILDSEGIKKITKLTSEQKIRSNEIDQEREKTITQQNVEAKEAILELNRQLAEAENKQKREVESMKAQQEAATQMVIQEERLKAEQARINTDEQVAVAEENKARQVIVARKNKEKTEAVENERLEKDRALEATEREKIVALSQFERDKAIELERKSIQDAIRERVIVEKTVVTEQEKIKDTQAFAEAERAKKVAITEAEKTAEEALVIELKAAEAAKSVAALKADQEMYTTLKAAEAEKQAAEFQAEQIIIEAEARQNQATKEAAAKKSLADALAAEAAAPGMAEVQVMQARADAIEKEGTAKANVQALAFQAEAKGIQEKAAAMKQLDAAGRAHEEYKLQLDKEKAVELAEIENRRNIAAHQAEVLAQALKSARVDIVGGEATFFDKIVGAVSAGKTVDRLVESSKALTDVKQTFFNADPAYFKSQLKQFFTQFNINPEDVKNLSVSALLTKMAAKADAAEDRGMIYELMSLAERAGVAGRKIGKQG